MPILRLRRLLLRQHLRHSRVQIHLHRIMRPRILASIDPMPKVYGEVYRDADVGSEERGRGPVLGPEDVEAVDEAEEGEADDGAVGAPGLHEGVVGEVCDALCLARLAEAEVDNAAGDPGDEAARVGEVDEPVEDLDSRLALRVAVELRDGDLLLSLSSLHSDMRGRRKGRSMQRRGRGRLSLCRL